MSQVILQTMSGACRCLVSWKQLKRSPLEWCKSKIKNYQLHPVKIYNNEKSRGGWDTNINSLIASSDLLRVRAPQRGDNGGNNKSPSSDGSGGGGGGGWSFLGYMRKDEMSPRSPGQIPNTPTTPPRCSSGVHPLERDTRQPRRHAEIPACLLYLIPLLLTTYLFFSSFLLSFFFFLLDVYIKTSSATSINPRYTTTILLVT